MSITPCDRNYTTKSSFHVQQQSTKAQELQLKINNLNLPFRGVQPKISDKTRNVKGITLEKLIDEEIATLINLDLITFQDLLDYFDIGGKDMEAALNLIK